MGESGQNYTPAPFTPKKGFRYPVNGRLCGPRAGLGNLEKNLLTLPEFDTRTVQPEDLSQYRLS
jgi:hypothetical protein